MSDLFVSRIKARKAALDLTMPEIADRAGFPQSTIEMYFYEQALPNFVRLVALARALDCSIDYLAVLSNRPERITAKPRFASSA